MTRVVMLRISQNMEEFHEKAKGKWPEILLGGKKTDLDETIDSISAKPRGYYYYYYHHHHHHHPCCILSSW